MVQVMPGHPRGRELPRFSVRQEELPDVEYWKVNGKYYLIVKVEMIAKSNTKADYNEDSRDKEKVEGSFQVLNIKALGDEPVDAKTLEQEDFERVAAKARTEGD